MKTRTEKMSQKKATQQRYSTINMTIHNNNNSMKKQREKKKDKI